MQERMERQRPHESVGDRLKRKLDHIFRPASSASEEAFQSIIAVLPEGDMKKAMETVVPQLQDMLKAQDKSLVAGSLFQRVITMGVFGWFGAVGGAGVGFATGLFHGALIGAASGATLGAASAFAFPTESQMERSRILIAGKQQEMLLRTTAGKKTAESFDSGRVNEITQAILAGTLVKGGGSGVLAQASNPMA